MKLRLFNPLENVETPIQSKCLQNKSPTKRNTNERASALTRRSLDDDDSAIKGKGLRPEAPSSMTNKKTLRSRHAHEILTKKYPGQMRRLAALQAQIATSMVRTQSTEEMVAVDDDELDEFMIDRGWGRDEIQSQGDSS